MITKKLPIGIQTFREMREENHYYVDKTAIACQLVSEGKYYFLSRPRRFGKSLFLDTLKELFEGNEPLFKGLAAEQQWDWSKKHPVIRISFGSGVMQNQQQLNQRIKQQLLDLYEDLQLSAPRVEADDITSLFQHLIRDATQAYQSKSVVLIDEYDKPILDNLHQPEQGRAMRDTLRNLYSVLKDSDAHLRFVFLTGVSKFSKVSLFSGLNNLRDITLSAEYSDICGYTDEDVDSLFAPELASLDRQQIRDWYKGYNWGGISVYNPFDLLLLFQERVFRAFWFETGTPTFLVDLLRDRGVFTPSLGQWQTEYELLCQFDVGQISTEALLFQAGYLTLHKVEEPLPGYRQYTLGFPNREVEASLNQVLLPALGMQDGPRQRRSLFTSLKNHDLKALEAHLKALYAGLPHDWYRNNPIAQYEGHYASIFYSHFAALGLDVTVEDASNHGKVDMTVKFDGHIFLFEFKVVEQLPEGKALQQIIDKGYADKYRHLGQPIHLIGVEFSKQQRQIVGFEVQQIILH